MKNPEPSILGYLLMSSNPEIREKTFELMENVARSAYTWIIGDNKYKQSATVGNEKDDYTFTISFKEKV